MAVERLLPPGIYIGTGCAAGKLRPRVRRVHGRGDSGLHVRHLSRVRLLLRMLLPHRELGDGVGTCGVCSSSGSGNSSCNRNRWAAKSRGRAHRPWHRRLGRVHRGRRTPHYFEKKKRKS